MPTSVDPRDTADAPRDPEDFPEAVVEGVAQFLGKPRLRGWIHVYAAAISVVCGATLVAVSWSLASTRAGIATLNDGRLDGSRCRDLLGPIQR